MSAHRPEAGSSLWPCRGLHDIVRQWIPNRQSIQTGRHYLQTLFSYQRTIHRDRGMIDNPNIRTWIAQLSWFGEEKRWIKSNVQLPNYQITKFFQGIRVEKKAAPVSQSRGWKLTQHSTMRPKLGFNTTQRWSQSSTNRNKSMKQQTASSEIDPNPIQEPSNSAKINTQTLEPRLRSRATQSIRDRQRLHPTNWPRNHPEPALHLRTLSVPSPKSSHPDWNKREGNAAEQGVGWATDRPRWGTACGSGDCPRTRPPLGPARASRCRRRTAETSPHRRFRPPFAAPGDHGATGQRAGGMGKEEGEVTARAHTHTRPLKLLEARVHA